jgi:hypothetical protein
MDQCVLLVTRIMPTCPVRLTRGGEFATPHTAPAERNMGAEALGHGRGYGGDMQARPPIPSITCDAARTKVGPEARPRCGRNSRRVTPRGSTILLKARQTCSTVDFNGEVLPSPADLPSSRDIGPTPEAAW